MKPRHLDCPATSLLWRDRRRHVSHAGMTLVEVMMALMMLVAFLGVYVAVTELTNRFLSEAEKTQFPGSQGLLVDHHQLQIAMDDLSDVLAQPGLTREEMTELAQRGCSFDPQTDWGLPGSALTERFPELPRYYRYCLHSTTLAESSLADLLAERPGARAGIYVLQALPEETTGSTQPARRVFCRPKPFC